MIRTADEVPGRVDDGAQSGQVKARVVGLQREAEPTSLGPRIGRLLRDRPLQIQPGLPDVERDSQLRGISDRAAGGGLKYGRGGDGIAAKV